MKKLSLLFVALGLLTGCFKDEPKLPQYFAIQDVDVAVDSVLCFSGYEGFDHFKLTCSAYHTHKQWYKTWHDNFLGLQSAYLGNDSVIEYPVIPHISTSFYSIVCYGITGADTTVYNLEINYCGRHIYIPTAFTPVGIDGLNDTWFPQVYNTDDASTFSIYWEIRSLDGIKIFESSEANYKVHGWDGTYNGYLMPRGSYLFYIELTFQGEDPVEYTGWLEMRE
ncbi:MAG: gliding motility-associated C-terminal domain-containing protein [Flavobacteriales bacterium]|nr:gliding motility-associated C-terminal domain-containing protein [Flavobacteriales bacterium]